MVVVRTAVKPRHRLELLPGPGRCRPLSLKELGLSRSRRWVFALCTSPARQIIDPETKNYLRILILSVENGTPVLMERVQNDVDPSLDSILSQRVMDVGGAPSIKIGNLGRKRLATLLVVAT